MAYAKRLEVTKEKYFFQKKKYNFVLFNFKMHQTFVDYAVHIINPLIAVAVCHAQASRSSYISKTVAQRTQNMPVYCIRVSQGSVTTRFGCGGIFHDNFIANFPESLPVKEF